MTGAGYQRRFREALAHLNGGDLAGAAAACVALLQSAPNDPALLQLQAVIALRAGRPAEAQRAAEQSLRRRPGHAATVLVAAQAAAALGIALQKASRPAEARAALARATALDPAATAAWFALGLTEQDLGDEASAAAAYERALELRADCAEAAVNLGIARQELGDMAGAMAAYRRAYAIRPDTLSRIAQAVTSASTGTLWLGTAGLRGALGG